MNRQLPPGRAPGLIDILVRVVAVIATGVVLVASFFVGAFVALALLGIVAIVWVVFAFRWWQLKRQWRATQRHQARDQDGGRDAPGRTTVDGDYRVVDDERRRGE